MHRFQVKTNHILMAVNILKSTGTLKGKKKENTMITF